MKKNILFLLILLSVSNLFAQRIIFPVVQMRVRDGKNPINLTDLSVDVKLTGKVAVTTYDMIFTNSSILVYEGEFEFPLTENQTVVGFALDVNGKLRQGVVVEKDKGRQTFEAIVRQGVDPGLLEQTTGNNYKARVYPFNGKSSRHVQIKVQEVLTGQKEYVVNSITKETLKNFKFNFVDYRNSSSETFDSANGVYLNTGVAASLEKTDYKWETPFKIKLQETSKSYDVFMQTVGTDSFFYAELPVTSGGKKKGKINNLTVYFDTSLSRKNSSIEKELQLLKKYINSQVVKSVEIISFANDIKSINKYQADQWVEIEKSIKAFSYDGATNLNLLAENKSKSDEVLIFSDGLGNWGKDVAINLKVPVNAISSSLSADYGKLKKIARDNMGRYINLASVSVDEGERLLETEALRLINVSGDKDLMNELYPLPGTIADENFSVAGILKRKSGNLKFQFGYGNKVEFEKTVSVDSVTGLESDYVSKLWASKKIEELSYEYESNKKEILELGKKYTIVTKGTSLIVLENISDYIRYGITPPEELKDEFNRTLKTNSSIKKIKDGIPQNVYEYFKNYKEWWNAKPGEYLKSKRDVGVIDGAVSLRASARASAVVEDMAYESAESVSAMNNAMSLNETKAMGSESVTGSPSAKISIQAWNPDVDYLKTLKKTRTEDMYNKYLLLRKDYEASPSFYMDVASYFYSEGLTKEALQIISNMAELNLENSDILRALGNKLIDFNEPLIAAEVFEKLILLRPEIPQFLRDAAKAYEKAGEYQKACDYLYKVVENDWDNRYNEIQMTCLNDMNSIIERSGKVKTSKYEKSLLEVFPLDIRVVLTWNTDDCDIDLWVIDPDDEKCYYGNKYTKNGGRMSRDFTRGYGPEEFSLKTGKKGSYKIVAHYFGNHKQSVLQPVVVQAEVYTNFGKKNQKCEILTLQLENVDGDFTIGEITF